MSNLAPETQDIRARVIEELLLELAQHQSKIAMYMGQAAAALLHQSGILVAELDNDANLKVRPATDEDRIAPEMLSRRKAGDVSTLLGDGGPLTWVFQPPAPYNDVEIVCSPDAASRIGMRCYAELKMVSGERKKYDLLPRERA